VYLNARGGHFVGEPGVDWQQAYEKELRAAKGPAKAMRAK
jgi:hypothetical protein